MQQFYETNYGSFTANGKKKSNNEDYYCNEVPEIAQDLLDLGSIFIVADGVGGAAHGELASKYAAELLRFEYYRKVNESIPERLRSGFKKATRDIYTYAEESGRFSKMATTMVAAVVVKNRLFVANVGDSRAYLIRNGNVRQITRDHSMVEEWVRDGIMTEEEARVSKKRNQLSRSIGGEPDVSVDIFEDIPLQLGDKILLCTDGLTRYARPEDIKRFCASGQPVDIAKTMVRFANQSGGADNTTVTLIEIVEQAKHQKNPDTKDNPRPDLKEWQKAETEYPIASNQPGKEKKNPLLVILPVLAISIFLFSLYIFKGGGWDDLFGDDDPTASIPIDINIPAIPVNPTDTVSEETPSMQTTIESQQVEDVDQSPQSDQTQQNQDLEEQVNQEEQPSTDLEGEKKQPESSKGNWECVYDVQSNDSIENIYYAFYDRQMPGDSRFDCYYGQNACVVSGVNNEIYEKCDLMNKGDCFQQKDGEQRRSYLYEASFVVVYESQGKVDEIKNDQWCWENGGKIFYLLGGEE